MTPVFPNNLNSILSRSAVTPVFPTKKRLIDYILVLAGSQSSFTEITEYKYFSLLQAKFSRELGLIHGNVG